MDTRQREKEKGKEPTPGERTPKSDGSDTMVQTWIVVKERHREGSGHGKMCGDWVIIDKSKENNYVEWLGKSRPGWIEESRIGSYKMYVVEHAEPGDLGVRQLGEQLGTLLVEEAVGILISHDVARHKVLDVEVLNLRVHLVFAEINAEMLEERREQATASVLLVRIVHQTEPPLAKHGDEMKAARVAGTAAQTRKRNSAEEGKYSNGKSECSKCCRCHGGECWKAMGACTRCGKMDHATRNCPIWEQSRG
ncbi:hypothetical protein F2Q69_00015403 [Brassica cretica]|uniref:CCHC-type domain-containing protein n=1 Tax=Brassica cretica TaxID=69181 RepID=A0A8S9R332_BRACR|nr:hypothetical protein F2Q69_00015403 [Brassica cretica]